MASRQEDFLKSSAIFSKKMPGAYALFAMLVAESAICGAVITLIVHTGAFTPQYGAVESLLTGLTIIFLPTVLTAVMMKTQAIKMKIRYLMVAPFVGSTYYCVFLVIASSVYRVYHLPAAAIAIIVVSNASIFAWWLLINKVLFGKRRSAPLLAIIQPTLNVLFYAQYSRLIFNPVEPLSVLLIKLYLGILVFAVASYIIIHAISRRTKHIGIDPFEAFSQMVRNWLYDANISMPFGGRKFGVTDSIEVNTIVFKSEATRKPVAIIFVPQLHYGPAGTLGGSDFPYMLESHAAQKYRVPTFILHTAADFGKNPISSSQFARVRSALDNGVAKAAKSASTGFWIASGEHNGARVTSLGLNGIDLVTFTRAPKVTEDIEPEAALLFKGLLGKFHKHVIVDAHNSRYETAPDRERAGVTLDSIILRDYAAAISKMQSSATRSKTIKAGFASEDIYTLLGQPTDLTKGNMNIAIFEIKKVRYALIQFNSNNMLPSLRNQIVGHLKRYYGLRAETYTTDTHAVNSMGFRENNVLGRQTHFSALQPLIDKAAKAALGSLQTVQVHHDSSVLNNFMVWGTDVKKQLYQLVDSSFSMAKIIVPIIVAAGFIIATWLISMIR